MECGLMGTDGVAIVGVRERLRGSLLVFGGGRAVSRADYSIACRQYEQKTRSATWTGSQVPAVSYIGSM